MNKLQIISFTLFKKEICFCYKNTLPLEEQFMFFYATIKQ